MKTPEYFYRKAAEELGMDEGLVEEINKFFWKTIKKEIRSASSIAIYVKHLGTFYTTLDNVNQAIISLIKTIKGHRIGNISKKDVIAIEFSKDRLKGLLKLRQKLIKQKQKTIDERIARISKTASQGNSQC